MTIIRQLALNLYVLKDQINLKAKETNGSKLEFKVCLTSFTSNAVTLHISKCSLKLVSSTRKLHEVDSGPRFQLRLHCNRGSRDSSLYACPLGLKALELDPEAENSS